MKFQEWQLAAAQSVAFLVAYHLISLGYFLGLAKSILSPRLAVPYLGFLVDSSREVFHIILSKKARFLQLIRDILNSNAVSVKTLERLAGKCVSFSLAVPAAKLLTREMKRMISKGLRTKRPIPLRGELKAGCNTGYSWRTGISPYHGGKSDISESLLRRMLRTPIGEEPYCVRFAGGLGLLDGRRGVPGHIHQGSDSN